MKRYAIILAAGNGERAGSAVPKQFIKVAGKTVIEHTLGVFEQNHYIDEIFVIINPHHRSSMEHILIRNNFAKVTKLLNGGATRRESSYIGISAIHDDNDIVLIHDGVRPFVSNRIINDCIEYLNEYDAIDVATPAIDTIIQVDEKCLINSIPNRNTMWRGQTPQGFKVGLIKDAHKRAQAEKNLIVTDDCSLVLRYGLSDVYVVKGEEENIKITYPMDIYIADKMFQLKSAVVPKNIPLKTIDDKVIAVFGGARGIGKAITDMANANGAKAYMCSRSTGVDVSSTQDVKQFLNQIFAKEGRIDFVVNTAAILRMGKLEGRKDDEIDKEVDINYLGNINIIKYSIPFLRESRGAILLFTSSSYTRGRALYAPYSSIKAAVVNLVQALSEEFLDDGIRINAINPERTSTPMRWESFGREPQDTLLQPEDVAETSLKTMLSSLSGEVIDVRKQLIN